MIARSTKLHTNVNMEFCVESCLGNCLTMFLNLEDPALHWDTASVTVNKVVFKWRGSKILGW